MGSLRGGAFTAADRMKALEDVETVKLRISDIHTMPVMFQPREIDQGHGKRCLDPEPSRGASAAEHWINAVGSSSR
jgi:hypothetical protein